MAKTTDLSQTRIDPKRRKFQALLENLQGNILKPHGREYATLIFFRITPGKSAEARAWIRGIADTHVTSAKEQVGRSWSRRPFCGLLLSAAGYRALGRKLRRPADPKFRAGMKRSGAALRDPAARAWEARYQGAVHALVSIGDKDRAKLKRFAAAVRKDLKRFAKVVAIEQGRHWRNAHNEVVEHFGFADGLSQPLFLERDLAREARRRHGRGRWDSSAPLRLVLARDPNSREVDAFGSYLVFRKLEQNVRAFRQHEENLTLALSRPSAGLAGALMVGRFQDGTPVALSPTEGKRRFPSLNDFTYAHDPKGSRCPFQAHIRLLNPRNQTARAHRILRCGITYGRRSMRHGRFTNGPAPRVGLLFMCFQRSIERQFEWLQRRANGQARRPGDPLIGHDAGGAAASWPARYGEPRRVRYPSRAFLRVGGERSLVTLKGGEYFFAPSLPFLKRL